MANPLTTWRGEPVGDFDIQQALAAIRARPDLSGFGGPHIEGSGVDAMMYDSLPFSATGSYFNSGMAITPNEDGTYLVYRPAEGGNASKLNGTLADKYDASGNYLGKEELKGISDASTLKDLATFAALAAGAGYGASALAGAGGAGAGAGGGWMSGVSGEAIAGAGMSGQGLAGSAGAIGASSALTGVPPPANPLNPASYLSPQNIANLVTSGGASSLLGPAATLAGALSGKEGQKESTTQTQQLPGFLQGPVANDLIPRTQGLLADQMPQAHAAGKQMYDVGRGLLDRPIAGNGYDTVNRTDPGNQFGKVALERPDTPSNPYLQQQLAGMRDMTMDTLGRSFNQIRGNSVGVGGIGGSRQGVAESEAMRGALDSLQRNQGSLMYQAYDGDMNRALSKYNIDTNFSTAQRGQDLQRTGLDMNFYQGQRQQDLTQAGVGAGLVSGGLDTQWQPINQASGVYRGFSPYGSTTTSSQSGGGWQGLLGGALSGAAFAGKNGWWG